MANGFAFWCRPRGPVCPASCAAMAALLLAFAGCAPARLAPSGGGISPADGQRLSTVVAQVRAQYPKLAVAALAYSTRAVAEGHRRSPPELVLRGEGRGVAPGIHAGEPARITASLYLSKPDYAAGHLELQVDGAAREQWRVVAFDQRGTGAEAFEFFYALADAEHRIRYLALIGGQYAEGRDSFRAIEGLLLFPGADGDPGQWRHGFKLDFDLRQPEVPPYVALVNEADGLYRPLARVVAGLEALGEDIRAAEERLGALRRETAGTAARPDAAARMATEEDSQGQRRARLAAGLGGLRTELVRYFNLRERIAAEYAAFTQTNRFTWALTGAQSDFHEQWRKVESHHPHIDALADRAEALLGDSETVSAARAAAMAAMKRFSNWERDPAKRPATARKSP